MSLDQPAISLDDIRNFRQLGSPCAGHPEYGEAAGIEMTTGPLGQGIGTSVGMAMAGQWFAARYNQPGFDLFGYNVYALCSDGDLMEGIGCEAASVAGHLKLSNLCWIYDDNHITIEGHTELAFSEDVAARFRGLGWNVVTVEDANDVAALDAALASFRACQDRPTLIVVRSVIGFGSPNKANSHEAHGAPLGDEEIRLTKRAYGWPEDQQFLVPDEVREHFAEGVGARGRQLHADWAAKFALYEATHPQLAADLKRIWARRTARRLGQGHPGVPGGRQGRRQPRFVRPGAQRRGQERALADRRLGRPGAVEQHAAEIRQGGPFQRQGPRRPQPAFRHPRAQHGGDLQRLGLVRPAALRRHLLRVHRLHAAVDAAGRHDAPAGAVRLDARLDRLGRRRPDAPAGRAPGGLPRHSRPARLSAGRRQRSGRGVSHDPGDPRPAGGPRADPAEHSHAGPVEIRSGGGRGPRRLRAGWTRRAGIPK